MQPKTAKRRSAFRRANRTMPRRRIDIATEAIDYKNPDLLKKFVTESGKILPRRDAGQHGRDARATQKEECLRLTSGKQHTPPSITSSTGPSGCV